MAATLRTIPKKSLALEAQASPMKMLMDKYTQPKYICSQVKGKRPLRRNAYEK